MRRAASPIVAFYRGEAPDDRGRYLRDIQQWPDERLESVHDFVQWMFPLADRSGANPFAPVLDAETIAAFDDSMRDNLRASFSRMMAFYGLEPDSPERLRDWLTPGNHNHLRLTRILKSLRLLGLEAESRGLYTKLASIYREHPESITERTFRFWTETQG